MKPFKEALFEYKDSFMIRFSDQSEKTIQHKNYVLDQFIDSLEDKNTYITRESISSWINSKELCDSTRNGYLCVVRDFIKFLQLHGIHCEEPILKKYSDDYIPYIFSDEEISRIILTADNNNSYSHRASTKTYCIPVIVRILIFSGLRLTETLNLKIEDYDMEKEFFKMHGTTKNKKERYVPIHESLAAIMKQYIKRLKRIYPDTIYLFPQNNGIEPITKQQAEYEINKIIRNAGITFQREKKYQRGICTHCFRHYFTTTSY